MDKVIVTIHIVELHPNCCVGLCLVDCVGNHDIYKNVKICIYNLPFHKYSSTVNSRYIEVEGTL